MLNVIHIALRFQSLRAAFENEVSNEKDRLLLTVAVGSSEDQVHVSYDIAGISR